MRRLCLLVSAVTFAGAVAFLLLATMMTACNPILPSATPSVITGGLVEKLTLDDLTARANLIVLGNATQVTYHKDAKGTIYTLVTFSLEQTYKGETAKQVVITVPGGTVQGQAMEVEDAPKFQLGERAVAFLTKANTAFTVVGGFQGKFTVDKNDMVGTTPLQQFIQQVSESVVKSQAGAK